VIDALIRILGGDPSEVRPIHRAIHQDRAWRIAQTLNDGLDLSALKFLLVIPVVMVSITLLFAAIYFHGDAGLVATLLLSAQLFVLSGFAVMMLMNNLLSDEDFRVVASWPIRGNSFLLARLAGIARIALIITAILGVPAIGYTCFAVGTPILTGLTLGLCALLFTAALVILISSAISGAVRLLGLDRVRLLVSIGIFVLLVTWPMLMGDEPGTELTALSFAKMPAWLPSTWPAALVALTAGQTAGLVVPLAGLGAILLAPLPVLVFRVVARGYTRGLSTRTPGRARAGGSLIVWWLGGRTRDAATRVMALLTTAHLRRDWRFRLQLAIVPGLMAFMAFSKGDFGDFAVFGDPFTERDWFHGAMLWMVLILIPPIISLPMILQSGDYKAAWCLQMGQVDENAFRAASRRLIKRVFLYPFLLILAGFYLWEGVPVHHVAAHLLVLFFLGDLISIQMQILFSGYPYATPAEDEEIGLKIIPVFLMLEIFGGMVSWAIYYFAYAAWWSYALLIGALFLMRRGLVGWASSRPSGDGDPEAVIEPDPVVSEEPTGTTTPLHVAIAHGHLSTAKVLLAGGADPSVEDPNGKTPRDLAEERGDPALLALFDKEPAH